MSEEQPPSSAEAAIVPFDAGATPMSAASIVISFVLEKSMHESTQRRAELCRALAALIPGTLRAGILRKFADNFGEFDAISRTLQRITHDIPDDAPSLPPK